MPKSNLNPHHKSSTHFGISNLGILKNLSGDEDNDDDEFLRRWSTVVLLQNSTHLDVLALADPPWFRLLCEKLDDKSADLSLTDLCLLRIWGSGNSELQNGDLRLKKSNRSKPQQKIRFSSMKKSGSHLWRKSGSDYEEMLVCCWEKEKGGRERRKRKGKERKRNLLVLRTWGRHVSDAGPTKMHVFTLLPSLLIFQKLKTTESCFQFPWLKLNFLRIELRKLS